MCSDRRVGVTTIAEEFDMNIGTVQKIITGNIFKDGASNFD
jgi:hypothetical protein